MATHLLPEIPTEGFALRGRIGPNSRCYVFTFEVLFSSHLRFPAKILCIVRALRSLLFPDRLHPLDFGVGLYQVIGILFTNTKNTHR